MAHGKERQTLECIVKLNVAILNIRLFPPHHQSVRTSVEAAHQALKKVLEEEGELVLMVVGGDLIANGRRLHTVPGILQFVSILQEKAVENVTLVRGISQDVLADFVLGLASHGSRPIRGNNWIRLGRIGSNELREEGDGLEGERVYEIGDDLYEVGGVSGSLESIRQSMQEEIAGIYQRAREDRDIQVAALEEIISNFVYGPSWMINPLQLLTDVKSYDEYTFVHMVNVCTLTMSQAESLGFTGRSLRQIGLAAALHDVGKLFIPERIINKTSRLSAEEWAIIETHPLKGVNHLIKIPDIPRLAVVCALEHHMRWDGSGYPQVAEGWKPHIVSQMIAIADVYDAMRSRRPYSEAHSQEEILTVLKGGRGRAFNPFLVDNFLDIISQVH